MSFTGRLHRVNLSFVSPDSMAGGIRWFAEYQPFTPVIDTVRTLLLGGTIDTKRLILALAWCVGLTLLGYLGARVIYNHNTVG